MTIFPYFVSYELLLCKIGLPDEPNGEDNSKGNEFKC